MRSAAWLGLALAVQGCSITSEGCWRYGICDEGDTGSYLVPCDVRLDLDLEPNSVVGGIIARPDEVGFYIVDGSGSLDTGFGGTIVFQRTAGWYDLTDRNPTETFSMTTGSYQFIATDEGGNGWGRQTGWSLYDDDGALQASGSGDFDGFDDTTGFSFTCP